MNKAMDGQMNIFDFIPEPKPAKKDEWALPCDNCRHDVHGCCDYENTPEDFCRLGDKWIPIEEPLPDFCHKEDNWHSIKTKPVGMDERLQLEILGKYRYNNKDCWSRCPAHIENNEIIADNVPFDIPRPEWMFWLVKRISVDIVGICDDAVCPICGHEFLYPQENDLEICPGCGQRMDWTRWHYINDNEEIRPDE